MKKILGLLSLISLFFGMSLLGSVSYAQDASTTNTATETAAEEEPTNVCGDPGSTESCYCLSGQKNQIGVGSEPDSFSCIEGASSDTNSLDTLCGSAKYFDLRLNKCVCDGVELNTNVPFVGDCIVYRDDDPSGATGSGTVVNQQTAFPLLMRALTNIVLTLILIGSFIMLVSAGVMIASGSAREGRSMIMKVVVSLVLLGSSGVILTLINPYFFG